jgi:enterochelin esterase-like enzyme
MPWDQQDRPPGTLHHERFYSRTRQRIAGMLVYTPPGVESGAERRYPVLVVLTGTPGDEKDWTSGGGFAEVIFDNLIAEGRMTPAIVAMHPSDVDPRAHVRRGDDNLSQLERIIVEEVVPIVRQRYPVKADAASWGIAGLSLGGEFAMYVGLRHPDLFGSLGSISGSLVVGADPEEALPSMDQRFSPALARPDVARNYKTIWVGCGNTDPVCRGSRVLAERLGAAKVAHTWREYTGGHQMPVFRRELVDFLQALFR